MHRFVYTYTINMILAAIMLLIEFIMYKLQTFRKQLNKEKTRLEKAE